MREGQSINYKAGAAFDPYLLMKYGAADGEVVPASGPTDLIIGGNGNIGAALGDRIDIIVDDFVEVRLGGTVTRGDKLTADANGLAVTAAPAAGANAQIAGYATVSGVLNDIIWMRIAPSVMQG
jgi:hypothetical protein